MFIKDGQTYHAYEVRALHPEISFAESTYSELGYEEYSPPAIEPVVYIPQVVSRFQALAALHLDGKLETIEAMVAQADVLTKLAWNNATEFRRNSPAILGIATTLGWSQEYLDQLFTTASQIIA